MTRTQIQLPDGLYRQAKAVAATREISLAELVRIGLEYVLRVSSCPRTDAEPWSLPAPVDLGGTDPFADSDWRSDLHERRIAEAGRDYAAPAKETRRK